MGSSSSRGPVEDPVALEEISEVKLEQIRDKRIIEDNFSLKPIYRLHTDDRTEEITASELWQDRCAIVIIVQRPGCPMCREQAQVLCSRMEQMATLLDFSVDDSSFNLIAIVRNRDDEDVQEFYEYFSTTVQTGNGINGTVFYDEKCGFFKRMRRMPWYMYFSSKIWKRVLRARSKGIKGNAKSNGDLLGGVMVINKKKIWYEFRENYFGDAAPVDEILSAFEAATSLQVDRVALNSYSEASISSTSSMSTVGIPPNVA